jgi:hypothetical protein
MCSDVAVTWSSYDTFKIEVETNVRHKIYDEIKEIIDAFKLQEVSDHFIAGLECAQSKVLGFSLSEKDPDPESVLFDIQ